MESVVQSSVLAAPVEAVWQRITTFEGVNDELGPWLRMTMPRGTEGLTLDNVALGEPVGRSWLLLLGFIPVDYDDLVLVELEPGRRFLERSSLLTMTTWQHERTLEVEGAGTRITDRLTFLPRRPLRFIPGAGRVSAWVVRSIFRHRHRRLNHRFGRAPGQVPASPP